ncbi:hypothetical protein MMC06_002996 [Schaereria dolodes]|nr:hypothetical protein [Schaereria dolodes]
MATTASYSDRKPASAIRPGLSHVQQPPSPHTPQRTISSTFSSPSVSYRAEEDPLVLEFGTRYFRAGYAGEAAPRCVSGFGPENSRRVGDYRQWLPGYHGRRRKRRKVQEWGRDHELWQMDLRSVDLGLVEDKVERAVREAYSKYLLLDSKSRRLLLVLPSIMPRLLLSKILFTLFHKFQNPGITLFPASVLNVVAAGLRSGLVVDIGWSETTITAIYEYREVQEYRTTRAMRLVTIKMGELLERYIEEAQRQQIQSRAQEKAQNEFLGVNFEYAEEVTVRMAWCRSFLDAHELSQGPESVEALSTLVIAEDASQNDRKLDEVSKSDTTVSIPMPFSAFEAIKLPFSSFSDIVEAALLAKNHTSHELDDHEQGVQYLIYNALLSLSPEIRSVCMSRIIITGGGSNIPGIKSRLIDEVSALAQSRGWDPVLGKAVEKRRQKLKQIQLSRFKDETLEGSAPVSAAFTSQISDPIEDKLRRNEAKSKSATMLGQIRGIETLGGWAGASLLAGLRIQGIVEIERDEFLHYGLSSARGDVDISVVPRGRSFGPGIPRIGGGDRAGWTLGGWA